MLTKLELPFPPTYGQAAAVVHNTLPSRSIAECTQAFCPSKRTCIRVCVCVCVCVATLKPMAERLGHSIQVHACIVFLRLQVLGIKGATILMDHKPLTLPVWVV